MRFVAVVRADKRIGVLDNQRKMFAHFHEGGPWSAIDRATTAAGRMNDSTDTVTGYVWEEA